MLPDGWKKTSLGDCLIEKPSYGANAASVNFQPELPRYLRITDIIDNGKLSTEAVSIEKEKAKDYLLNEDDFLIARSGNTVGKSIKYSSPMGICAFAGYLLRFKFDRKKTFADFFKFIAQSDFYWNWIKCNIRSGAQPNINAQEYSSFEFLLPPFPEQQKIAKILSTWDEAIEKMESLVELKERRKKGLMNQLLTGRKRFKEFGKEAQKGELPDGWEVKKLESVTKITMGSSPKSSAYNNIGNGLPLVQGNADIKNRKVIPRIYTTHITSKCEVGDIIFSVRAPVGDIAITDVVACIGRGVAAIRALNCSHDYVYHILLNQEKNWGEISQGSTFEAINSKDLKRFLILLPLLPEQQKIAKVLSSCDEEIEKLNLKIAHLKEAKKGLMQQLLTGKKRVNVNV